MKRGLVLLILVLLAVPFAAAYGVTFYNPAWNPQDGKIFDQVDSNTPYVFNVRNDDISIRKITFTIEREATNAGITVYNLRSVPDDLPEVAENDSFEFNELKYSGFVPHDTKKLVYEFRVAKGWLENMTVSRDTVALHSYDPVLNIWQTLPTKIISDDDSYVYYHAEGTGTHYLFIGKAQSGEKAEAAAGHAEQVNADSEMKELTDKTSNVTLVSEVSPVDLSKPASQPAPQPQPTSQPQETGPAEDGGNGLIIALVIVAIVILAGVIYLIGRGKGGTYSVDKELNSYIKESLKRGKTKEEIKKRLLEVGWHHERVEKALGKHKEPAKEMPEQDINPEPEEHTESMSLAEAKVIAERQKKAEAAKKHSKPRKQAKSKKK